MKSKNLLALLGLSALLIISLLYRLTPVLTVSSTGLMSDDATLMIMARQFYEGNFYAIIHPFWMPLFPLSATLLFRIVHDWEFAGVLTSAMSGVLLLIPIYFIGKSFGGRLTGLLAGFFLIFFFPVVQASRTVFTESLQVFLFWMGVYFYFKALDNSKIAVALLSGVFFGLSFLTRSEGLFSIVGLVLFLSFVIIHETVRHFKISDNFFKTILFVLSLGYIFVKHPYLGPTAFFELTIFILFSFFLLIFLTEKVSIKNKEKKIDLFSLSKVTAIAIFGILIFYLLYNGMLILKYKKPLFSAKASAFLSPGGYFSLNSSGTSTWGQDVVAVETFNPNSEFTTKTIYESAFFKNNNAVTGALNNMFFLLGRFLYFNPKENIFLFFIGLYLLFFKSKQHLKVKFLFLMFMPMIFLISIISIDTSERYLYFAAPIVPVVIAFAITYFLNFLKQTKIKIVFLLLSIFLVTYFNWSHLSSRGQSFSLNLDLTEYKIFFTGEKAKAFKEDTKIVNMLKNKRVMGRHEGFAFYSRSLFVYSPTVKTLDELVNYAKRWHAAYIIASQGDIDNNLDFLYSNPRDYPGLKLDLTLDSDTYLYKVLY